VRLEAPIGFVKIMPKNSRSILALFADTSMWDPTTRCDHVAARARVRGGEAHLRRPDLHPVYSVRGAESAARACADPRCMHDDDGRVAIPGFYDG